MLVFQLNGSDAVVERVVVSLEAEEEVVVVRIMLVVTLVVLCEVGAVIATVVLGMVVASVVMVGSGDVETVGEGVVVRLDVGEVPGPLTQRAYSPLSLVVTTPEHPRPLISGAKLSISDPHSPHGDRQ